jgi:hypothetical protein
MLSRGVIRFLLIFIWPLLIALLLPVISGGPGWTTGTYVLAYFVLALLTLISDVAYRAAAAVRSRRAKRPGKGRISN